MTLYRELGTVRPRQESLKYVNISYPCYGHSYIYIYINMTLYRELGTVRPQQESIKNINTSHPHANVLKLCSLLSRYVAYLLHPFIVFFIYIYMTLYRELGTVRARQEFIKYVNISHHCYGHSYI